MNYEVNNLKSSILWNEGTHFTLEDLPVEAQIAPVFAIAIDDFNHDENVDIWLGGNFYALKPQVGRHDASRGVLLQGNGNRNFEYISHLQSGIKVKGEVRDAVMIDSGGEKAMIIAKNNDKLAVYKNNKRSTPPSN